MYSVRKDEVKLLFRLEAELQRCNERALDACKHETLSKCVCNLIAVDNVRLADGLQGVDALRITLADLHDLAKAALANDSNQLEVVDPKRLAL